jgi:hypothetical protein
MFNILKRNNRKNNDGSLNESGSTLESSTYPTCSNETTNLLNQQNYQSINNANSKKFSKCPTCNGTGKVCKGIKETNYVCLLFLKSNIDIFQEDKVNLVALIPLTDNRLKPKRM